MISAFSLCVCVLLAADESALAAPAYSLKVGQRIDVSVASRSSRTPEFSDPSEDASGWKFWVIEHANDRGWHIVLRYQEKSDPKQIHMASFWMTPQGIMHWDATRCDLPAHLFVDELWPRLPTADELAVGSWEGQDACSGTQWRHSLPKTESSLFSFRSVPQNPLQTVSGGKSDYAYEFDADVGFVTRVTIGEQFDSYREYYRKVAKFESVETLTAEQLERFRADWQLWTRAAENYRQAYGSAGIRVALGDRADSTVDRLSAAADALRQAVDQIRTPEIRERAELRVPTPSQSDERAKTLDEAALRLDKPSPEWSAVDLKGNEHAIARYRGQVVLLDFWFRQCSYCIRLAPQLERIERQFAGRPFALLSMNTDENVEDARIASERLQHSGPVIVHADEVAKALGVEGYPTLVLIDTEGRVHDVFVGYSPNREEDLRRAIERLLPAQ